MNDSRIKTSRRLTALGLSIVLGIAACGGDDDDTTSPSGDAAASSTLVVASPGTPPTLDTEFFTGTPQSWEIANNLYDTKVYYPDDGVERDFSQFVPKLFESIEPNADGTVWTFKLRDDIKDKDGKTATAEDFKYAFERAAGVNAVGAFLMATMNIESPDSVKVVDDLTTEITLNDFSHLVLPLSTLSFLPLYDSAEVKEHATTSDPWASDWLATNAAGYGPYYLEENTAGVQTVLRANPNYYLGKPSIDRIIYRAVPESSNRLGVITSGDADVSLALSGTELDQLESADGVEVTSFPGNNITAVIPNFKVAPLDNVQVRQAMAYAAPYDAVINDIFNGWADPIKSYLPPMYPGYTDEYFPYTTDVDKAKQLMSESGVATPINLALTYADHRPENERIAIAIKSAWQEIGINVTLNKVTFATFAEVSNSRDFELIMPAALQSHPVDPVFAMEQFSGGDPARGFLNYGSYNNAEVNELYEQARAEPDPDKRIALIDEVQRVMADDPPWIVLALPKWTAAHQPDVTGIMWAPDDGLRFAEMSITSS